MNPRHPFTWILFSLALSAAPAAAQSIGRQRAAGQSGSASPCLRPFIDETAWRLRDIDAVTCAGSLVALDIDGDGDEDLLVAQDEDLGIWVNDGSGVFRDERASRIGGQTGHVTTFGVTDVDGDGDLDFSTGGDAAAGFPDRLWINRGGAQNGAPGNFVRDTSFPTGLTVAGRTSAMVFADADGDGDPDLLLTRGQSSHGQGSGGENRLLLNRGLFSGQFVSDPLFAAGPWNEDSSFFSTDAGKWADVDGDGDPDILLANSDVGGNLGAFGHPNHLLLNDGLGSFTDATLASLFPNWQDNTFDVEFADLDGDGDQDIVAANSVLSVSSSISGDVLLNQGGLQGGPEGSFLDDPTSFLEAFTAADGIRLSILTGDLDGDGDADAFLTVHDLPGGGSHHVWINQGGHQAGTTGEMGLLECFDSYESISSDALLVDIDGDDDLDLIQTHCGSAGGAGAPFPLTLYRNTRR